MEAIDVKNAARRFGADLIGIAPLSRFEGVGQQNDPRSIFPLGKTMIVIGRRILRGSLRGVESGNSAQVSFCDFGFYMLEDQYLAKTTYDLVLWMENQGVEAVPMFGYDVDATAGVTLGAPVSEGKPAPNVYVDWKVAAHLCGLGEIGKNGLFITPEFGTLQRFAMIISDREFTPDEIVTRNVCNGCNACTESCLLNNTLCKKCTQGAVQTDFGRFHTVDKISAACGRACLASLEERGLVTHKFAIPSRKISEVK